MSETRGIPTDSMDLTIPWRVRCFEPNRALFLSRPEGWGPSVARNIDGEAGLSAADGGVGWEVGDCSSEVVGEPWRRSVEWEESPLSAIDKLTFALMVWSIASADFEAYLGHLAFAFVDLSVPVILCASLFWLQRRVVKLRADLVEAI